MAPITIYLPGAVEKKARRAANADGMSVSRWIAERVAYSLHDVWQKVFSMLPAPSLTSSTWRNFDEAMGVCGKKTRRR
jgi:hypothetical protein